MEWKLFGGGVRHPVLKVITVIIMIILMPEALVLSPVLVPLHFILRKKGLNGFYFDRRIKVGRKSFHRRSIGTQETT